MTTGVIFNEAHKPSRKTSILWSMTNRTIFKRLMIIVLFFLWQLWSFVSSMQKPTWMSKFEAMRYYSRQPASELTQGIDLSRDKARHLYLMSIWATSAPIPFRLFFGRPLQTLRCWKFWQWQRSSRECSGRSTKTTVLHVPSVQIISSLDTSDLP